jgi:hypothetical protein
MNLLQYIKTNNIPKIKELINSEIIKRVSETFSEKKLEFNKKTFAK